MITAIAPPPHHLPDAASPALNRVLLVGSDESAMRGPLERRSVAVVAAATAQEGCAAIAAQLPHQFDAIVADWPTQRDAGELLLEMLRHSAAQTPVIALIPPECPELIGVIRRSGVDDWLLKAPGYPGQLPYVVEAAVEHARAQHETVLASRPLRRNGRGESHQLAQLASLRDSVIDIASHQLRNPLTVILGYSALLTKSPTLDEDERTRHAVEKIRRESLRLRLLVDDLLEFSRLELGQVRLEIQPLDLAELIRAVVDRRGEVRPHLAVAALPYVGDYARLQQVSRRLLALRAADGSPTEAQPAFGVALGRHTGDELCAAGLDRALPADRTYATIAIGAAASSGETLSRRDWHRATEYATTGETLPERELGLRIAGALVGLHGGALYTEPAGDYLITLPLR